jgi:hypothetical protein
MESIQGLQSDDHFRYGSFECSGRTSEQLGSEKCRCSRVPCGLAKGITIRQFKLKSPAGMKGDGALELDE